MRYDVVIMGAGLSGLMAARTAAEHGLRTLVLAKGMGIFHAYPGGVDLLGYYPEDDLAALVEVHPVLDRLIQDKPSHPYAKVGREQIESSLDAFSALFDSENYHYTGGQGSNTVIPTGVGTKRPSYLIPSTMFPGKDSFSQPTLLVGFNEFTHFCPAYAARNMNAGTRRLLVRGRRVSLLDITGRKVFKGASLAVCFEDEGFRERLASKIREIRKEENLVAFPAVLGLKDSEKVRSHLESLIEARIFELPVLPPSIPAMRLYEVFRRSIQAQGVRMVLGFEVTSAICKNGYCRGVVVDTPTGSVTHEADAFVLATGRLFGGGLRAQGDRIVEPLFRLPVSQPRARGDWFGDEFFGKVGHPINKAGIMTNDRLNPVDQGGRLLVENLFGVGSILGFHDALREKSAEGVDISTGYKAIQNLLER